jgi:hypothetical protein
MIKTHFKQAVEIPRLMRAMKITQSNMHNAWCQRLSIVGGFRNDVW